MLDYSVENIFTIKGKISVTDISSPFLANDPTKIWYIAKGKINLSGTKVISDAPVGKVQDFATLKKGDVFLGIKLDSYNSLSFMASPQEETTLYELDIDFLKRFSLRNSDTAAEFEAIIRNWLATLFTGLEDGFTLQLPDTDVQLRVGKNENLLKNQVVSSIGQIIWCESANPNAFVYNDLVAVSTDIKGVLLPLSRKVYVRVIEDTTVVCPELEGLILKKELWEGLKIFHHVVIEIQLIRFRNEEEQERQRLIKKHQKEDENLVDMLDQAKKVLSSTKKDFFDFDIEKSNNLLFDALQIVAKQNDIKLVLPPQLNDSKDPMEEISRFSCVRYREISLEGKWWKKDNGPFVAFYGDQYEPVAIVNAKANKYMLVNPANKEKKILNKENSKGLSHVGYMLYKPLPADIKGLKQILSFCLSKDKSDYYFLILLGFLVTILGMATPFFTSFIFDNIILNAEKKQLIYVGLAIAMSGIAAFLFEFSKGYALLRIESKMDSTLQAGIWDRILNLPTTFFSQYTAGDLANRSLGINQIRQVLSGAAITSILAGLFSVINLFLLFYYSVNLALVALLIVAVQISVNIYFAKIQIKKQKKLINQTGKMEGIVLQLLTGITKFRVSGTEHKAFAHWFNHYLPIKNTVINLVKTQNISTLFNTYFQYFSMMVLFVMMADFSSKSPMTLGEFLSFNAAYGIFAAAMNNLSSSLMSVFNVLPIFERTKPILETPTENNSTKHSPNTLKGAIEFSQINFSYEKDGPQILKDINLTINSGEYIAFVGPSGSGKSTLIRLILGFNEPNSGTIYFDGQNLSNVDPRMVRQQIGVVLQNGSLFSGDIFQNITGASGNLTVQHAWAAAESAAFDEDIKKMPMGMHTMVSESGSTISGGQKQRLMIARALVHKPKILIFDEATSALDNRTQAIVTQSLDELEVTRIVVAHRLSTIKGAHTIYYLEAGKIIEKGGYEDLMALKGKFFELANRQIE
jgi:NHLM bacteriocin system ABC transporter ATP-binding protein